MGGSPLCGVFIARRVPSSHPYPQVDRWGRGGANRWVDRLKRPAATFSPDGNRMRCRWHAFRLPTIPCLVKLTQSRRACYNHSQERGALRTAMKLARTAAACCTWRLMASTSRMDAVVGAFLSSSPTRLPTASKVSSDRFRKQYTMRR